MGDYALRHFTADDLPMMAEWLATPAATQWWGDPAEQLALVTGDLDDPQMDQRICSTDAVPFGYAQSCEDGDDVLVMRFDPAFLCSQLSHGGPGV